MGLGMVGRDQGMMRFARGGMLIVNQNARQILKSVTLIYPTPLVTIQTRYVTRLDLRVSDLNNVPTLSWNLSTS